MDKLNERLAFVKDQLRKKRKWQGMLQKKQELLRQGILKAEELKVVLQKKEKDVAKLERITLNNLFYTVVRRNLEKLDQEQREAIAARLKYEESLAMIEDIQKELIKLEQKIKETKDHEIGYKNILSEKEKCIHEHRSIWCQQFDQLIDTEADISSKLHEYDEALKAGSDALEQLKKTREALEKAKGWSTWDMFGDGIISTAAKYSHLKDAQQRIHEVQHHLREFQLELEDIERECHIRLEIGNLFIFSDCFFDGLLVDWAVHGRITDSLKQMKQTEGNVESLYEEIEDQRNMLLLQLTDIRNQRITLIEQSK